ncbi:hypothetical protein DCS_02254 [Drechmeria coniospora]|uniref:Uncharacterized protein n=1 Tax=Drechmeria coniospora TaxID=98403 RepID=A0A151GVN4_DRECN|nr:hypothetical protein DCS_02254 [Drechmeria coniospora]KYK61113.1 hypothetical protein DCS_02254 [Drechmeria coniospora]ODA80879.1 hypothetical protein RJ55_03839 [Drechmeria coniospora]
MTVTSFCVPDRAHAPVPAPCRHTASSASFFQLPTTRKRRQSRLEEQRRSEEAARQEEAALRAQAWIYLHSFLKTSSDWCDLFDHITIVRDAVPTMPELNSYGELDEKDGTLACRRLFRAVVVWDELGRSLWRTLRDASEQRLAAQRQFIDGCCPSPFAISFIDGYCQQSDDSSSATSPSHRTSRRTSEDSSLSLDDDLPSQHSTTAAPVDKNFARTLTQKLSQRSRRPSASTEQSTPERCSCCSESGHSQSRSRSRSQSQSQSQGRGRCQSLVTAEPVAQQRSAAMPRRISQNCASAVRRTLGVLSEGRTSPSPRRQSE